MQLDFQLKILLDVFIAMVLGAIIGFEREEKDKPAGLRTNMIIAGASALLLTLGRNIAQLMQFDLETQTLSVDPTRIIHAIIVGVSFIGAGTILKSNKEETVKYLTTSATILMSSATGICVALKLYVLGVGVTVLTLLINSMLRKFYS